MYSTKGNGTSLGNSWSKRRRNLKNSWSRGRAKPCPTTRPGRTSKAANRVVVPWQVLDEIGCLKPKSRQAQILKLRRLLLDLGLTNYDMPVLGGTLAQIQWKLNNP